MNNSNNDVTFYVSTIVCTRHQKKLKMNILTLVLITKLPGIEFKNGCYMSIQ